MKLSTSHPDFFVIQTKFQKHLVIQATSDLKEFSPKKKLGWKMQRYGSQT